MIKLIPLLCLLLTNCTASNAVKPNLLPVCIESKIQEIKKQPKWNPAGRIEEYEYNGKKVYIISAPCCDNFNSVVDENCNYICAPSGGITGKGDRKCPDFTASAKFLRVVWQDER